MALMLDVENKASGEKSSPASDPTKSGQLATSAGELTVTVSATEGEDLQGARLEPPHEAVSLVASADGKSTVGTIAWDGKTTVVVAKVGDARTPSVTVTPRSAPAQQLPGGNGSGERVVEVETGEWDPVFGGWSLAIVAALFIALAAAFVWLTLPSVRLPAPGSVLPEDGSVDGTWLERVGAVSLVFLALGGIAVALLGAWMLMVETRGRQRASVKLTPPEDGITVTGVGDVIKDIPAVIKEMRTLRGSMTALIVGGLIVAGSMFGIYRLAANSQVPEPSPSPTSSLSSPAPSPTQTDTGDVTPSPTP